MAKLAVDSKTLEGRPELPDGVYEVRLDGFKPKKDNKGESINLNPQMKVVNNATFNDQFSPFESLSLKAGWNVKAFFACFGVPMGGADQTELPLDYTGPDDNPAAWTITSPAVGRVGRIEVGTGEYQGKAQKVIKRYFSALP